MNYRKKLEKSKQNIIIRSIIIGNSIDFNKWFDYCNKSFKSCLGQTELLNGYHTSLFCSLFDLPARAKALNMLNHNGYNCCINCNICGNFKANKVIFPYNQNLSLRSNFEYKEILKTVCAKKTVKGCFRKQKNGIINDLFYLTFSRYQRQNIFIKPFEHFKRCGV